MDSKVKLRAEQLAQALAESEEYQRLRQARAEIEKHEAAKVMLADLQEKQQEILEIQLRGEQISMEKQEEYQKLYETISFNPYVRDLLQAEALFGRMMVEVQKIISEAIPLEDEEQESESGKKVQKVKSKLWTPG